MLSGNCLITTVRVNYSNDARNLLIDKKLLEHFLFLYFQDKSIEDMSSEEVSPLFIQLYLFTATFFRFVLLPFLLASVCAQLILWTLFTRNSLAFQTLKSFHMLRGSLWDQQRLLFFQQRKRAWTRSHQILF